MALSYFPWFNTQFTDANGNPLSGGKVYAFYDGSSTPAPTYTQNGTLNANPIILDSSGRCDMLGDDSITYKIVVYSSSNALIKTYTGIVLPSGNGGTGTVTMDTIAQGTSFRKMSTSNVNSLTQGTNTTLHFHSADRVWSNITEKPTTFTPALHAATHENGGTDQMSHNSMANVDVAGVGVTRGHITNGIQTISGKKIFNTSAEFQWGLQATDAQLNYTEVTSDQVTIVNTTGAPEVNNLINYCGETVKYQSMTHNDGKSSYQARLSDNNARIALGTTSTTNNTQRIESELNITPTYATDRKQSLAGAGTLDLINTESGRVSRDIHTADGHYLQLRAEESTGIVTIDVGDSVGVSEYKFPESPGVFNIATREWFASNNYAKSFSYTNGIGELVWTLNHNLGYYPVVMSWDSSGQEVKGSIQNLSLNALTITFTYPQTGSARCV